MIHVQEEEEEVSGRKIASLTSCHACLHIQLLNLNVEVAILYIIVIPLL